MKIPKISLKIDASKIKATLAGALVPIKALRSKGSREPWVVRFVLLVILFSIGGTAGSIYFLKKMQSHVAFDEHGNAVSSSSENVVEYEDVEELDEHAAFEDETGQHEESHEDHNAAEEHAGNTDEHGAIEGDAPALEFSPIPDEIVKRQNGIPAAGYDLKEPEKSLFRELASVKTADLQVRVGNYFVDLDPIYSNARVGTKSEGALSVSISLEASDALTRREVEARKEEFRGLVNSILFEFQKGRLLTHEGKMELKQKIQASINYKLKKGRVVDILFSNFHMQ